MRGDVTVANKQMISVYYIDELSERMRRKLITLNDGESRSSLALQPSPLSRPIKRYVLLFLLRVM